MVFNPGPVLDTLAPDDAAAPIYDFFRDALIKITQLLSQRRVARLPRMDGTAPEPVL